ncbi:uncharacterized protein Y057_8291 [Fusarium fujikuroi]|nr:uncharacterized protein Y057_8291 [Fusarium fujikuroi]
MEKAKQAVSSFLSNDGKHRTTVDEDVKPHVTQEHVMPHQHERVTTALDKEVHQEHHHTTVQPITHKETLPEQHHHNLIPVEHKTFHHGNEQDTRATLDREAAKYRDTTETYSTTHSTEAAPVVTGERIHHHVHEHVQPVINKETVQPHVVHTTIPIHETHHAAPVHHGTSTLPAKTLEEFTQERGGLKERAAQKLTEFEGCPKPYRRELQGEQLEGDKSMHLHGHGDNYGENQAFAGREGHGNRGIGSNTGLQSGSGIPGTAGAGSGVESMGTTGNMSNFGSSNRGIGNTNTAGLNKPHTGEYDQVKTGGLHNDPLNSQHSRGDSGVGMQTGKKPSLLDRLNPMKDADGDGKKGLLD